MFRFMGSGSNIITLKRVAKFFSTDGSGGIYQTILPVLSKFENAGLEYFYVYSDNNILCRVPDLQMVGCAVDKNANSNLKVFNMMNYTSLLGQNIYSQQFHSHRQYSSSAKDNGKKFRRFEYLRNQLFTLSTLGTLMIPLGAFVGWQIGTALFEIHSLAEKQSQQHSIDAEPKPACSETVSNVQDFVLVQPDRCFDKLNFLTDEMKKFYDTGLEAISKGKLAVITLTTGEGSSIPNGIISLGTSLEEENDSILFLQAAQISYLQQKAKGKIIWMIMTNKSSEEKIRKHLDIILKKTKLDAKQVFVFVQNENPTHDFDGKVLLSSPYQINTLPDGTGGIYQALLPALPKFENAGLEYFYVCSDNNILCRVPDLDMVGCAIDKTADCVVKVIEKKISSEEIGKLKVLDFSKISKEVAEKSDPKNPHKLFFREGNINNYFFTLDFLKEACLQYDSLPFHELRERIPFWNPSTRKIIYPIGKNGIKKERFILDAFIHANNFMLWQINENEFCPLKNSEGVDCLSKCVLEFNSFAGNEIREMVKQFCRKKR
ncbi:unnamed protein product [Meloidogyne enterolobii]|uniref:Uncharacterized protein n=1 Tax=Meloidogyne enterolobii TaxID=390850 RepID=A0ACB1AMS0_MELEN